MAPNHEYSLLGGINRALVGRYLSILASSISAALVFAILTLIDLAKTLDLNANIPPTILSLVGAGAVFTALYAVFDKALWRWSWASRFLKVPDLSGEWECAGTTLDHDGNILRTWQGSIVITQTWDKIRVRLTTHQSSSHSITAALAYDEADGYTLLYNYKNEPRPGEPEIRGHSGSASLVFGQALDAASGNYFNGYGRPTYGRMELRRKHE